MTRILGIALLVGLAAGFPALYTWWDHCMHAATAFLF